MLHCGRIVLVARFLHVFCPRILEHKDCAHEGRTSAKRLTMDLSFRKILRGVMCLWRIERCDLISEISCPSVNRLGFRRLCILEHETCDFFNKATDPFHHVSFTFYWADCQPPVCLNMHFSPNLHLASDL